jgi:hypothetical protein
MSYISSFVHDACSWRFPRSALRPLAERNGKILPEHIDFLEKIAYRQVTGCCSGPKVLARLPDAWLVAISGRAGSAEKCGRVAQCVGCSGLHSSSTNHGTSSATFVKFLLLQTQDWPGR